MDNTNLLSKKNGEMIEVGQRLPKLCEKPCHQMPDMSLLKDSTKKATVSTKKKPERIEAPPNSLLDVSN